MIVRLLCGFAAALGLVVSSFAVDRTLTVSGVPVTLQDLSGEMDVTYTSMRLNRAINAWNVEVSVRNKGTRVLSGPFAFYVDAATNTTGLLQPDGVDAGHAYLDLSGQISAGLLAPGQSSAARTLTLGNSGTAPQITARVYGNPQPAGFALALTRSLNEIGQPLPDVLVEQTGPAGQNTNATDSALGLATLGGSEGPHVWKFSRPGYLTAWRNASLQSNVVTLVPNPRLVPRATNSVVLMPIAGGTLASTGVQISFGPGTFAQNTTGVLTRLTGQTLPALLPLGWSPLLAFNLDLPVVPFQSGTATLTSAARTSPSESVVFVRWNEMALTWDVAASATGGASNFTFALPTAGTYALVIGDTGSYAPPAAAVGQALQGSTTPFSMPTSLTALGTVTPSLSPASRNPDLVTATAEVTITNTAGPLPSGVVLRCEISETYDLAGDTRRVLPRYESFIVGYQRPGDGDPATLTATFPIRPLLLLDGAELKQANVQVDVLAPQAFTGGVFDERGGQVAAGGVRILAAAGTFTNRLAINLELLDTTNFWAVAGTNVVYAFELNIGSLPDGKRLTAQFNAQTPNSFFVLGRVISRDGWFGVQPVERFASDATGKLTSVEPTSGARLPGITSGGQFVLVRVAAPQGLVTGAVRNSQLQLAAGLPVHVTGQHWLAFSADAGAYTLIAPTGAVTVTVIDLLTDDSGTATTNSINWQNALTVNVTASPAGPRVVSIAPESGSTNVALVSSVTLTFSKPVNVGSAVNGIVLLGTSNQPVSASLSFNLRGTAATLLPTESLAPSTLHTVFLSTNITDLAGRRLEGTNVFVFTTRTDAIDRGPGATVTIYEPTNGMVRVTGSQGIADSSVPVILVNDTSGETSTTISKPDGSFDDAIRATADDFISAVFVNQNGTRNTIPASKQLFRDGRVGLFNGGGILEATNEVGAIQVLVEPGSVPGKTVFKIEALALTNFPAFITNTLPENGKLLGGFKMRLEGDALRESMDVVYPVTPSQLGLPAGTDPTNATYCLAVPRQMRDPDTGETNTTYELVDRMQYENGKLVTHSPPFFGLLGGLEDFFVAPMVMSVGSSMTVAGKVFAAELYASGRPIVETARYLPGALVTVVPPNSSLPGVPGRIRPGTVFTTAAGTNANFAFMVPISQGGSVVLRATHPRFPNLDATLAIPALTAAERFGIGNILTPTDLVFPLQGWNDSEPPYIGISHSPDFPPVGSNAVVRIVTTDNASRPQNTIIIDSATTLDGSSNIPLSHITMLITNREDVGAFGRREYVELNSRDAALVKLRVRSVDESGNDRETLYPVAFGGSLASGPNPIPPPDTNDHTGPIVISSTPTRNSTGFVPGKPIVIRFDEPIDRMIVSNFAPVITMMPGNLRPVLQLSDDQLELSLYYSGLQPNTTYTLMINSGLKDLSGNGLDQDPIQQGNNAYTLTFKTAPITEVVLPNVNNGGGAVVRGIYAYVLERQGTVGKVKVFSLANPSAPAQVAELSTAPYPRDLVLIPNYSFKRHTNDTTFETKDLLAVVGGQTGLGNRPWLRVIDISDPLHPSLLVGVAVSASPENIAARVQWSAPTLAYMENGSVGAVSIVDLQTLILSEFMTREQFLGMPRFGSPGVDANGDGDYVDPGDVLPLPAREPIDFSGKIYSYGMGDTDQWIDDFAMGKGGSFLGVIARDGHLLGTNGLPTTDTVYPCYRTLVDGTILEREPASWNFTNARPHRVSLLEGFPLTENNQVTRATLALVTIRMNAGAEEGHPNRLVVLNVTDATDPQLVTEIPLPESLDAPAWAVQQRDDGLLMLATDKDVILIDPTKFLTRFDENGIHPAIVGVIPNAGDSARTFGGNIAGLNVMSLGGDNQFVQSAPSLQLLQFTNAPFNPQSLVDTAVTNLLARLNGYSLPNVLAPARYRTETGVVSSSLSPPLGSAHYYVLVRAPGSAGPTIDVAIEALNWAGEPLRNKGLLFAPVHALTAGALANMGQTPGADDAPIRSSTAWRLSSNPASEFYNVYLSRPFALIYEETSKTDLQQLQAEIDRDILWTSDFIRISLDPSLANNSAIGKYAGVVDSQTRTHVPGVELTLPAWRAEFIQSPNPGPIFGGVRVQAALNALNAHSGELVIGATDMTLPGRRLPIEFRRTSCSQSLFDGPFGRGWDFNYNQRIVELKDLLFPQGSKLPQVVRNTEAESEIAEAKDLLFFTGAGRTIVYKFAGTNAPAEVATDPLVLALGWTNKAARYYLPPNGLFHVMFKFKDGRYARLEPDGKQFWFNAAGRLTKIYDRYEANTIECVYNQRGDLVRLYDELHRALDIGYYRLATDPERRAGIDVTTGSTVQAGKIARLLDYSNRDILYYYNADGLLEKREGPKIETAAPNGFTGRQATTYVYSDGSDPSKSAKSLVGVVGGDTIGSPLVSATEIGNRGRDTVSKLKLAGGDVAVTLNQANTARAVANGNATASFKGPDGSTSDYSFDAHGRPTMLVAGGTGTNAFTYTNRTEYYSNGLVKSVTYPEGNVIEYFYDLANPSLRARANMVKIRKTPGPRGGSVYEATTAYDNWYNLPAGVKTDFNTNDATIYLTSDHRETERVVKGGLEERYSVNSYGQIESHTATDGIVQGQTYTDNGFVSTKFVGPLVTTYSYAPANAGASDFTLRGLPSAIMDPEGFTTDFVYDERNQLVSQKRAGLEVTHAYNVQGDETETRTTVDAGRVLVETKTYNQVGFMTSVTKHDVETEGGVADLVTTYVPDELNRLKMMIGPGGDKHILSYDNVGRQNSYTIEGIYSESYTYDGNGNLTSKTIGTSTERYIYDGHDRMVKVVTPSGAEIATTLDGNGNMVAKQVRDSDGRLLSDMGYTVDALNRYRTVTRHHDGLESVMRYDFFPADRKIVQTDALGAISTTYYDEAGRETRTETPTKVIAKTYDRNNNLKRKETTENGRTFVEQYGYNGLNQLTNVTDHLGHSSAINPAFDGRVRVTVDRENHAQTNFYTLLGEVSDDLTANGVATRYTYTSNRQVKAVSDTASHAMSRAYDGAGRLLETRLPNSAATLFSSFNPQLQPLVVAMPRGITSTMSYDAEGRMTNRLITGFGAPRQEGFVFDGMQRPTFLNDPNSSLEMVYDQLDVTREYRHTYRFLSNAPASGTLAFAIKQETDLAGFRTKLIYPNDSVTVTNGRDITGRLTGMGPINAEPVVGSTDYAGDRLISRRVLGGGRIAMENVFDDLKRPTARRFVRLSDGKALSDVRYAYDRSGAQLARQFVHRAGRADFFQYDNGYRLSRADVGARPSLGAAETPRVINGFTAPSGIDGTWSAGWFARVMGYDSTDLFTGIATINPDGLAGTMATNYASPDEFLFVSQLDGFTRTRDEVGNVTRTRLAVRLPGGSAPVLVGATLHYDALGQLSRVVRDDGVEVLNEYNVLGLRIRRAVTGSPALCVPSDVAFIYESGNLIEIRDLLNNAAVVARFYYADEGDDLIAGDLAISGTNLVRHYYLTDTVRSVLAVADANGQVVERVIYDAWGQPLIESADDAAPVVAKVQLQTNSFLVTFTEAVLPAFSSVSTNGLITSVRDVSSLLTLTAGGQPVAGVVRYEESVAGAPFGSSFRFIPSQAVSGAVVLTMNAGFVQDEANNVNGAQTLSLNTAAGATLYTGPSAGSTAPARLARSAINSPFLFQGQVFDNETGLLYCRARFYHPYSGLFIQRDPAGYADGVNLYAGFANNPINLRDPSGLAVDDVGRELSLIGSQASYQEDGPIGYAIGKTLEGVGAILQLGTGAAEGVDVLEHARPGTWGLLDAMHGGELIANDLKTGMAAFGSMYSMGKNIAGRIEGYIHRRDLQNTPHYKRVLYSKGWHGVEPDAIVKTMKEMNVTELQVREFRAGKEVGRRIAGELGYSKKPGFIATKTSGPLSTVTHGHWDPHSGNVWNKTYTGDLDINTMRINGRRATPAEINRFITRANINYARMWKKAGGIGVPNVPFRHGAHQNLADMYGKSSFGKKVDNALIEKIGHPGDCVSIRVDGWGNVSAGSTPRARVYQEILESEVILKAMQSAAGHPAVGFPKNWHEWPQ